MYNSISGFNQRNVLIDKPHSLYLIYAEDK